MFTQNIVKHLYSNKDVKKKKKKRMCLLRELGKQTNKTTLHLSLPPSRISMNKSLIIAVLNNNLQNIHNKNKEGVGGDRGERIPQFRLISSMRYLFLSSVSMPGVKAVT